jgi:hypothetical protein
MHILCWFSVFMLSLITVFFFFLPHLIQHISTQAQQQDAADKMRGMGKALLKNRVREMNWFYRMYRIFFKGGVILFIGLVMGHWTLFAAYLMSYIMGWASSGASKYCYENLPAEWKGEDKDGNGVPDDEEELLAKAGKNPIALALDEAKAKKAAEQAEKEEHMEEILDKITGEDD